MCKQGRNTHTPSRRLISRELFELSSDINTPIAPGIVKHKMNGARDGNGTRGKRGERDTAV